MAGLAAFGEVGDQAQEVVEHLPQAPALHLARTANVARDMEDVEGSSLQLAVRAFHGAAAFEDCTAFRAAGEGRPRRAGGTPGRGTPSR